MVVQQDSRLLLGLLMRCAADTLLTLGRDPQHLGAHLGITAVLHTWTRTLQYHAHVHCIVTGGGPSLSGQRWLPAKKSILFAAEVMRRLFRGRFMMALRQMYSDQKLTLHGSIAHLGDPAAFRRVKESLYAQK